MEFNEDFIIEEIKNKLDIQYYHNVFDDHKEIKGEWMLETQKPENLVEDIFRKMLIILQIPENKIVSQSRVKIFDVFKDKNRYPDFKIIKHRTKEKDLLIELEPYNTNIQVGITQAEEWIRDIRIGTVSQALVVNLNHFILVFFDGKDVKNKELTIAESCKLISDIVFGKKISIKIEDINKITKQFYNQFYAIIHGGVYINIKKERIIINEKDSIINNLIYADRLNEEGKVEFIYSIFNRLIFIKILIDWDLFPDISQYLRRVPEHLIHTELNNLFFKTLAVKEEERVNLPEEFIDVPFLNGGLFRKTDIEKKNQDLMVNPKYLTKIFDFLEEYSFLANGDDNSSINSEILGYIFEKTIEFRKGTGSYYTHTSICDFMCESVLFPHFLVRINDYLESIGYKKAELLENFEEIFMLKEKTLLNIYEKIIKNLKVCDICVGSGAFLLAMGNLLLDIHKRLLLLLNKPVDDTEIKRSIVENNLYGVDLMISAIQICQLRLWLWISEGSIKLSPLPNIDYNLRVGNTLLGSDTSIDISTVNYKFINKINSVHFLDKDNPELKAILTELNKGAISFKSLKLLKTTLINLFLYSHDENTVLLKDLIDSLNDLITDDADRIYLDFLKNRIKSNKFRKGLTIEFLRRLKAFHWYLEFPQVFPKGFDVIVGNPPYISTKFMEKIWLEQDIQSLGKEIKRRKKRITKLKSIKAIQEYKDIIERLKNEMDEKKELFLTDYYQEEKLYNSVYKEYLKKNYKWTYKIYDILIPFFEKGFKLLKDNKKTYLSFITSNKFLATDYGKVIRKDFLNSYQIDLLVDISMIKVFKDAAVYPIIITIKNTVVSNDSLIKIGRYKDINQLGNELTKIEQERYNNADSNYIIYIPLHNESFKLFDKLFHHPNCSTIGNEFINYYREFDFTNWKDYEVFVKHKSGNILGDDFYLYITNNDFEQFQIQISDQLYFHRKIPKNENPKSLSIPKEKWDVFRNELLMIKEVALDLKCVLAKYYANIGKIYALRIKEESELINLSNYYFLALLNSRLLDFYFRVVFWNTHLSGGYLNYHFSYLSIVPILRINPDSNLYKRIITLSKCLEKKYNDNIRLLLELLLIHAHFPKDLKIETKKISFIDNLFGKELTEEGVYKLIKQTDKIKNYLCRLSEQEYYEIISNERQFKD
ncbi:hypothetical protein LCGC14_1162440 [marine sediment metagenome]|uniref:site-specific DNA-methyltransferase (adenine-specific) n=1 Tax=marine sediment metagenome TaxID=412755 RepID=A0A0F9MF92_9ZZZZ